MPETITIINPVLGFSPFVLLQAEDDGSDDGFTLSVRSNEGPDGVAALLMLALDQITGVPIAEYARAVEAHRQ